MLNAADFDTSFSGDGRYFSNDEIGEVGTAIKRQDDGKLVVAGSSISYATLDSGFVVQRFHPDGTPDSTFGRDPAGRVFTEFGIRGDLANDVLIQPGDSKIIAVGVANSSVPASNSSFALARYNPDGSLDDSFGSAGLVTSDITPQADSILGAVLQADGKVVVAGLTGGATGTETFTVARYLSDGTLDDSFGTGGVVFTPFNQFVSRAAAVAIDAEGRIVAVGTSNASALTSSENYAVARYNPDGTPDSTFDGDGKVFVDFERGSDRATSLAIQGDGRILVAGDASGFTTRAHFGALRLNPDGSLDTTWAGDGTLRLPFTVAADTRAGAVAVLLHSDGRVVLAGHHYPASGSDVDFALVRLTETGEPDPTFDGDGIRTLIDIAGGTSDQAGDAILLPGERIIMVGASNGGRFDTALAQFKGGVDFAALRLGTLAVVGTAGDDTIDISRVGQDYVVTRNGITNTIDPAMQPAGANTLNVLTLGGNDSVTVNLVRPGTVSLGAGDDTVTLAGGGVGVLPLMIDGATGADALHVPVNAVVPVTFNGGINPGPNVVHFTAGDGDDTIDVSNASVTGSGTSVGFSNVHSVNIDGRGGNDVINWANDRAADVQLGDGNDTINFTRGSFSAIVTVSGGSGDDIVVATTGGTGANVAFDPGAGTDKVIFQGRDLIDTVSFSPTEVAGLPIVRFAALELLVVNGNGDDDDISGTLAPDGPQVEINGGGGNDGITVNFAPGAKATVHGGDGTDALNLAGTPADDTITLGETGIDVSGESIPFTSIEKASLNGATGSDTLIYSGGSPNLPTLDVAGGGGGTDVLRLRGGDGPDAFTLVNNNRVTHGAKIIGLSGINEIVMDDSAGADALDAQGSLPVRLPGDEELASLTIGRAGRVIVNGERSTLRTGALTIEPGGRLDVGTGELHVAGGDIKAIEALMKTAREGSVRWMGPGIGTRSAGDVTGLCAAEVATPTPGVRLKYTYNGDANLDGRINADDYFRIDSAFLEGLPEPLCATGDFNFDDKVNADDYFLIDSAFLGQGQPLGGGASASAIADDPRPRAKAVKQIGQEDVWSGRSKRRRGISRR